MAPSTRSQTRWVLRWRRSSRTAQCSPTVTRPAGCAAWASRDSRRSAPIVPKVGPESEREQPAAARREPGSKCPSMPAIAAHSLLFRQQLYLVCWGQRHCSRSRIMYYRWTWIWRTTVQWTFAYDGQYSRSQSHAYQVCVICIWQILHMMDQFSWSHWVRHIQVHLYITGIFYRHLILVIFIFSSSPWYR